MSSVKKWSFKNLFTSKYGSCGCGPNSSTNAIVQPKPIKDIRNPNRRRLTSSSASTTDNSPESHDRAKIDDSLAVVKKSDDPYRDFRRSMLQMIIENEIYSVNDLHYLLNCFLELNSPHHHRVIVRAFVEIWNGGGENMFLHH